MSRDIETLEEIQNRALRFIFKLQGRVRFTDLHKHKHTYIEPIKSGCKTVKLNFYCKYIDNSVISDTHCNAPLKTRNTRQKDLMVFGRKNF